ncbi:lysM domain receptor-like kinase 4 [Silene latifolia]|uniref:lysM domain receptor-like kinase 4 n=1 Tax=Silene latifolia TaxID=37657 RepID=UPI003D773757
MGGLSLVCVFIFGLIYHLSLVTAQQPYTSKSCDTSDKNPSDLGYSCNGVNKTCQSYLIFRTVPSYNNVSTIASLMSVKPSEISAINQNISETFTMATNTEVIIPVTCSCSGKFYQANTTYVVQTGDNYYALSIDIFGGLTTCDAIKSQITDPNISPNERLTLPLRCACPTEKQVSEGISYLMSFAVQSGDSISSIANKFGANLSQTLEANEKSEQDSIIQPISTLLVPLKAPPDSSVMEYPPLILSSSPPLSSNPTPPPAKGGDKKWAYFGVGVVSGGVLVLMVGMIVFFVLLRCRKNRTDIVISSQKFETQEKALLPLETECFELKDISGIASLKVYSIKELQAATDSFSSDHWIKGSVYKGILDGNQVAVKKIIGDVGKEISVLNKINHFNLVSLLGVGFNEGILYLVYEYAVNGPLSDWINRDDPQKSLSWRNRMQVALDVAMGLNYLHTYTSPPLIHKDIKSSNILLDPGFRAKISKFGLSRSVSGTDGQFTITKHIVGTKGYLAPEYMRSGLISPMLDVYSFGVLLVEMLTGKNVVRLYEEGVKVHLLEVLTPLVSKGEGNAKLREFIDQSLGDDYPSEVAMSMVVLADHCLRKDPGSRPTMEDIVRVLSDIV